MLSNTSKWTMKKNSRGGYELAQDELPVANFWNEHSARLVADVLNADALAEQLHNRLLERCKQERA